MRICREFENWSALSGKFLRQKSCYPESFRFLWLCIWHLQHFDLLSTRITFDDSRSNLGFVFFPGKLFYGPTGFWFRRPVVVLTRTPKVRLVPRPSFHSSLTPCCHREKNIYASGFRQKLIFTVFVSQVTERQTQAVTNITGTAWPDQSCLMWNWL